MKIEINDYFFNFHGNQRVFFGDFQNELKRLEIDSKFKVLYVTDPPYNIGYHYDKYSDSMGKIDYRYMLKSIPSPRVIIHYPEATVNILPYAFSNDYCEKVVQWVYNGNTPRNHRSISWWNCKPDFNRVLQPYKNPNDKRIKEQIKKGKKGARSYDWFNINQIKNVSKEKTDHPCQIPIEVFERIIKLTIDENDYNEYIVIDPFAGSGSSGVACKNLGIKYIGFDISDNYVNIANKRLGVECYE